MKLSLVIISSNKTSLIKNKLASVGLDTAFISILGADIPGNKEEKITKLLGELPEPDEVFFITDTVGDIKEVQELPIKIKSIAVGWGFHSKELLEKAQPDFLIKNPDELIDIVKT